MLVIWIDVLQVERRFANLEEVKRILNFENLGGNDLVMFIVDLILEF